MRRPLLALLLVLVLTLSAAPAAGAQEAPPSERAGALVASLLASGLPVEDVRVSAADEPNGRLLPLTGRAVLISWVDRREPNLDARLTVWADDDWLAARLQGQANLGVLQRHDRGELGPGFLANPAHRVTIDLPLLTPEQAAEYDAWLQAL